MTGQDSLSASLSALTKAAGASIFTRPSGAHAFANQEAAEKKPVRESAVSSGISSGKKWPAFSA
jgi:hypothetical protein